MPKILLVEDSLHYRESIRNTLNLRGFEVIEAESAEQAFMILKDNMPVDMLIVDIHLPDMDGVTFCEQLKKDPSYDKVIKLALTTETDPALVSRAKACGVKGWIIKPYSVERLLTAIGKWL